MNSNEPSGLAWATLICGIGSWVILPLAGAIAALICGMIERGKIARGESPEAGNTIVLIGMVLGGIQVVTTILAIAVFGIFICGIPCLMAGAG